MPDNDGEADATRTSSLASSTSIHLVVLVHGLWGNPNHLKNLANSLQTAFPDLHIHLAKRNSGNFTYDGIELGGERLMNEVEDEIKSIESDGETVDKISFAGYSMGGLVTRYAIGLLYAKGILGTGSGKIRPMNFTTFASPHIGTRTPVLGWQSNAFNAIAARTLSASGNQMWCIDDFRDTGRPLLAVMADKNSVFIKGLDLFERKSIYSNIVNDRAVPFYTAHISDIDPFVDISTVKIHYEPGYEDVIVAPSLAEPKSTPATWGERSSQILGKMPFYLAVGVFAPLGSLVFLGNAAVQSFQSAARIKLHEEGKSGIDIAPYRSSFMTEAMQKKADEALERINSAEGEHFLSQNQQPAANGKKEDANGGVISPWSGALIKRGDAEASLFPKLALTQEQFEMKATLDSLGIDKYAVHIKNVNHSHACIIIRTNRFGFGEGKVVSRHWTERFEV